MLNEADNYMREVLRRVLARNESRNCDLGGSAHVEARRRQAGAVNSLLLGFALSLRLLAALS